MPYKFFYIPAQWPESAEAELNAFLAKHAVQSVDKYFHCESSVCGWYLSVAYQNTSQDTAKPRRRSGIDYREVLNDDDFEVFDELRRLRKQLSEELAVPLFTVFTNEQLATMVTKKVHTLAALRAIEGVGQSRCDRFGEPFLKVLQRLQGDSTAQEAQ